MIIDGNLQSEKLRKKIKDELKKICQNTKDVPKLSVILIGNYLPYISNNNFTFQQYIDFYSIEFNFQKIIYWFSYLILLFLRLFQDI